MKLFNKSGSTTVFLCIILSTILLLVGFFGEAAAGLASRPYANAVFDLAGRSILSEYDKTLKSQYGLFGALMDVETVEEKLGEYAETSFSEKKGAMGLIPLKVNEIKVDASEHTLLNIDVLEGQIIEHMKYQIVIDSLKILDILNKNQNDTPKENPECENENPKMRTLRSGKVINELPSRQLDGIAGGLLNLLDLPDLDKISSITRDELCLNRYIIKYFHNELNGTDDTFFSNEIEYILCGRFSDEANRNIVYLSLLAFRTAINSAHIISDESKRNAVTAAAAIAGGGVATAAAEAAIIGIWAGAEAVIDMNRLGNGSKVPLIKTSSDWRLGLDAAMDGDIPTGIDDQKQDKGMTYEDYLFLLLCFKNRESKLIRIMDLIQLNIKGSINKDFTIAKCLTGFHFKGQLTRTKCFPGLFMLREGKFTGTHVY